jgi:chorismate mutase/prephenate dehydratase
LRERIQDQVDNFTRFLILGHEAPAASGQDKTSVLFSVRDMPGSLYHMLKPFAEGGINLTKIESRPRRNKLWEYVFFIDLDGHFQEKPVARALEELGKICIFMKILGSYPKSRESRKGKGKKPQHKGRKK